MLSNNENEEDLSDVDDSVCLIHECRDWEMMNEWLEVRKFDNSYICNKMPFYGKSESANLVPSATETLKLFLDNRKCNPEQKK